MKHYFALCCIVKNEEFFIEEWLCYHSLRGVEHFYIYDNMSELPLRDLPALRPYLKQGLVTLMEVEGHGRQIPSYGHCLREYGADCRWIGFIDLDEFIHARNYEDLRAFLAEFEPYAGLVLNWRTFSSGGHISRPAGLVINNFTESLICPAEDLHFKSIVNPRQTSAAKNPHTFLYQPGTFCVTETHLPVPEGESFGLPTRQRAWINHYYYRSQQDFERKIRRGRASVTPDQGGKSLDSFHDQNSFRKKQDTRLQRFVPALEQALRQKNPPLFLPSLPASADIQQYIDLARDFALRKEWEKAEVVLCRAALHFAASPLVWLTRAFIARQKREYPQAEQYLHHALNLQELPQIYLELIRLRLALNQNQEALNLLFYLRHSPSIRVLEQNFQNELRELEAKICPNS